MPTLNQIVVIKSGMRALGWTDQQYRMCLRNVAGVESCKELDNPGIENVLAIMEESGFATHPSGPTYWRDKVAARGSFANARMLHKIEQLAGQQRYCLPALCERFSGGRTQVPDKLRPQEAWKLIEMLKAAAARETPAPQLF